MMANSTETASIPVTERLIIISAAGAPAWLPPLASPVRSPNAETVRRKAVASLGMDAEWDDASGGRTRAEGGVYTGESGGPHDKSSSAGKSGGPHDKRSSGGPHDKSSSAGKSGGPHDKSSSAGKNGGPHDKRSSAGKSGGPHDKSSSAGKSGGPHDKSSSAGKSGGGFMRLLRRAGGSSRDPSPPAPPARTSADLFGFRGPRVEGRSLSSGEKSPVEKCGGSGFSGQLVPESSRGKGAVRRASAEGRGTPPRAASPPAAASPFTATNSPPNYFNRGGSLGKPASAECDDNGDGDYDNFDGNFNVNSDDDDDGAVMARTVHRKGANRGVSAELAPSAEAQLVAPAAALLRGLNRGEQQFGGSGASGKERQGSAGGAGGGGTRGKTSGGNSAGPTRPGARLASTGNARELRRGRLSWDESARHAPSLTPGSVFSPTGAGAPSPRCGSTIPRRDGQEAVSSPPARATVLGELRNSGSAKDGGDCTGGSFKERSSSGGGGGGGNHGGSYKERSGSKSGRSGSPDPLKSLSLQNLSQVQERLKRLQVHSFDSNESDNSESDYGESDYGEGKKPSPGVTASKGRGKHASHVGAPRSSPLSSPQPSPQLSPQVSHRAHLSNSPVFPSAPQPFCSATPLCAPVSCPSASPSIPPHAPSSSPRALAPHSPPRAPVSSPSASPTRQRKPVPAMFSRPPPLTTPPSGPTPLSGFPLSPSSPCHSPAFPCHASPSLSPTCPHASPSKPPRPPSSKLCHYASPHASPTGPPTPHSQSPFQNPLRSPVRSPPPGSPSLDTSNMTVESTQTPAASFITGVTSASDKHATSVPLPQQQQQLGQQPWQQVRGQVWRHQMSASTLPLELSGSSNSPIVRPFLPENPHSSHANTNPIGPFAPSPPSYPRPQPVSGFSNRAERAFVRSQSADWVEGGRKNVTVGGGVVGAGTGVGSSETPGDGIGSNGRSAPSPPSCSHQQPHYPLFAKSTNQAKRVFTRSQSADCVEGRPRGALVSSQCGGAVRAMATDFGNTAGAPVGPMVFGRANSHGSVVSWQESSIISSNVGQVRSPIKSCLSLANGTGGGGGGKLRKQVSFNRVVRVRRFPSWEEEEDEGG